MRHLQRIPNEFNRSSIELSNVAFKLFLAKVVVLVDIIEVKVPIAILSAEIDDQSPPELIKEFEAALVANEVNHFVKIYLGVKHGWVVRYNDDDAAEVESAKEAQQDLVDWFVKCL
ncbi:hypothetical protein R6Q59_021295 [Mikania micrantha]